MQVALYKELESYIKDSKYQESLKQLMDYVILLIDENKLHPSTLEIKILGNHLSEMVNRAENNEKLAPVDKQIFANVRDCSLALSQKIVDYITKNIGQLAESEKYVLSIHFENMIETKEEK